MTDTQTTTDRLAEVLDAEERAETVQSLRNHAEERKRKGWWLSANNLAAAADIIEQDGAAIQSQQAEIERLREAMKPFAAAASIRLCGGDYWTDDKTIQGTDIAFHVTFGDLKRAAAALNPQPGKDGE